jgi:hypothetical protein
VEGAPFGDVEQRAVKVKCLCEPCNNEWVKDVGQAFRATGEAMARDIALTLDANQTLAIARWVVCRAMVWDYARVTRNLYFSDIERLPFRQHGRLPDHTHVWLGRLDRPTRSFSTFGREVWSVHNDGGAIQWRGFLVTLQMQHLIAQILTGRVETIAQVAQFGWPQPSAVKIWPAQAGAIRWPPTESVRPNGIMDFHTRFGGRIKGGAKSVATTEGF